MFRISQDEYRAIIQQLDMAIRNHEEWFSSLNRQMLCRLPFDQRNLHENAYRECLFGQWLYQHSHPALRDHPAFESIEKEHQRMHQLAARVLLVAQESGSAQPDDYDHFSNSLQRLRLEVQTLKRELETTYYNRDSLTGANTRVGMLTYLREQLELVRRGSQQLTLAMIDLDHFKTLNDTHGHVVGDRVLAGVARFLLDNIRPYDRLYRYGGEEFLLSLSHTGAAEALTMIERLRNDIEQQEIITDGNERLHVTASFGLFEVTAGSSIEEAVHRADQALYQAKLLGRNQARLWTAELADSAV
jgi:diguanylate cyclase (GGDEF)-like protein